MTTTTTKRLSAPVFVASDATSVTFSWSLPETAVAADFEGYSLRWRQYEEGRETKEWASLLADGRLVQSTCLRKKNLVTNQGYCFSVLPVLRFPATAADSYDWSESSAVMVPTVLTFLPDDANFIDGHCTEQCGMPFNMILDMTRHAIFSSGLATKLVNPALRRSKMKMDFNAFSSLINTNRNDFMTDIAILSGLVFTYWEKIGAFDYGIMQVLRGFSDNNPRVNLSALLDEDVIYWPGSKKHGVFVAVAARPDGTILISKDSPTEEVYLAQGIANSIHSKLPKDATGAMTLCELSCTLLCWKGRIVYDGTLVVRIAPASDRQRYLDIFNRARQGGTIITSLKKVAPTATPRSQPANQQPTALRRDLAVELLSIRNAPMIPAPNPTSWVLRRLGYTEAANPDHLIAVVSSDGSMVEGFTPLSRLSPSETEAVKIISRCVSREGRKPDLVMVDAIEIVDTLKALLDGTGLTVFYYPPPSEEEQMVSQLEIGVPICAHCGNKPPPVSQAVKLLKCGRCRAVHYCDADCQQRHWPVHKGKCKKAP